MTSPTVAGISPPPHVLAAFGATGTPERLPGGTSGRAFRAGDLVLERVDDPMEADWCAEALRGAAPIGVRIPQPVPTAAGAWTVDGWAAWEWVPGAHAAGRWAEVFEVADAFHAALAHLPRPDFLDRRSDPWSIGDRVAWGEASVALPPALDSLVAPLLTARRPLDGLPSQVIHGDLGGNVLFADAEGLAPAVIDFVPYYRPAGFAVAIAAVDALAWEGADASVLDKLGHVRHLRQLLIRAALYRIVTTGVASPHDAVRLDEEVAANRWVVELVCGPAAPGIV